MPVQQNEEIAPANYVGFDLRAVISGRVFPDAATIKVAQRQVRQSLRQLRFLG